MRVHSSLHNHTTYGDGKNTPEQMVKSALALGLSSVGLSEHSPTPFDPAGGMPPEQTARYAADVRALAKQYAGKIEVALGLERDAFSPRTKESFDYVIGSVHYVKKDGLFVCVDESKESFARGVQAFGGDVYAFAEAYFEEVSRVVETTRCDIVGHFDLFCKFNADGAFFDPEHPRYRRAALVALETLLETDAVFEINTGAMSRGYRREPYPQAWMLRHICERGGRVTVTSDAHDQKDVCAYFDRARDLARSCGFREAAVWEKGALTLRGI